MWPVTSHVYKWATPPGLPVGMICTQLNGRTNLIFYGDCTGPIFSKLLIWWKGALLKTCPAVTSITNSWMHDYETKCQLSHMTSVVSCLPEYRKNAQGHYLVVVKLFFSSIQTVHHSHSMSALFCFVCWGHICKILFCLKRNDISSINDCPL